MKPRDLTFLLMGAACVAACATQARDCPPGEEAGATDTLYFGTAAPGAVVTEADWNEFLRGIVSPAFPAGFTTWDAHGQWRNASGEVAREASHILQVVHRNESSFDSAVAQVISSYKKRFAQESVLRVTEAACFAF